MSDDYQPRRRGRPAKVAQETAPAQTATSPVAETTAPVPQSKRRPRGSVGGFGKKLTAPPREGYVRRFVNDTGNRIAEMQELGYTLVEEPGVQTFDPGSRINRLAGTKDGGAPLKTYLMETPLELYEQGVREKEEENRRVDQDIEAGRDTAGGLKDGETYQPRGHRNSITVER